MRTCIKCGKNFVDPKTLTCSWCGTKIPESSIEKDDGLIEEVKGAENTKIEIILEKDSPDADKTLNGIAIFILIASIILSIVSFFNLAIIKVPVGSSMVHTETVFSYDGLVTSLVILFSGIVVWAVMKVIRNISINTRNAANCLKKIAEK